MVTRTIEQITTLGRIQIKEDARRDNHLLRQKRTEEVQPIGDIRLRRQRRVKCGQVEPDIERRVRHALHAVANLVQSLEDVVALLA